MDVRAFERDIVCPALEPLHTSRMAELHRWFVHGSPDEMNPDDLSAKRVVENGLAKTQADGRYRAGILVVGTSRETMMRVIEGSGVFVWNLQYRLDAKGQARARPIATYRMQFDQHLHTMIYRFTALDEDTPVAEISGDMIQTALREAFWFYETFSFSDRSPF